MGGHRKRILILSLIATVTALYFWTQSRYPDLNAKAVMAQSGTVADTISARPILSVKPADPFVQRVVYTTINWSHDNRKGMAFGVFFAAIFLTLAALIPPPGQSRPILNTLYGFFVGAPLGVCVNCAAPIFKGLLRTERVETAFAAMLSSPTMNVVVLTMVFTLFPLYMGLLKLAFALIAIFIGVPVLSRVLGRDHTIADFAKARVAEKFLTPSAPELSTQEEPESWGEALKGALTSLTKNTWFMVTRTVPLMLVAGFLGSLLSHTIPVQFLADQGTVGATLLAAIIGVLLPVPMAFDVMLSNALYTHGAPVAVVMTLLCTLGIFSMYSFFITWQSTSKTWAWGIIGLLTVMGFGVGLLAPGMHDLFYINPNLASYRLLALRGVEESAIDRSGVATVPPFTPKAPAFFTRETRGDVHFAWAPFETQKIAPGKPFKKLEGHEIGLTKGFRYGIRDYPDPFWIGRGTAASDYDQDGWVDLVFGTEMGIALYKNRGGFFERVSLGRAPFDRYQVYAVHFVDFDHDGWPEIFLTTFNGGNFIVKNQQGQFDVGQSISVPNGGAVLTVSPNFGDFDGDGEVDILNGNMALGIVTGFNDFSSRRGSHVVFQRQFHFTEKPLLGDQGETMSTLVSDLDGDGHLDVYMGHDFVFPDALLKGDGRGGFKEVATTTYLASTPVYTMGLDSGDLNNDLKPDLLLMGTIERRPSLGQYAIDGISPAEYSKPKWTEKACDSVKDPIAQANCRVVRSTDHFAPFDQHRNLSVDHCQKLDTVGARQDCLLSAMWLLITNEQRTWDCDLEFGSDRRLYEICVILKDKKGRRGADEFIDKLPQVDGNYVYLARPDGGFADIRKVSTVGEKAFDHPGGWTWGARIADLDHDGWQDIFTAEGAVRTHDYGFNTFMRNAGGDGFEQKQFTFGLTDDFNLFSFSMIDFDGDGDLDIIGNSSVGPIQVYENQATTGRHSVVVGLGPRAGESGGIGAKIYVDARRADGTFLRQVREIKGAVGYMSQDGPLAYFGLGDAVDITAIRIRWPSGKETALAGPLPLDRQYRVF
jgi:uncharacterized membrane protein YraQ (UPF0718 family)